MKEHYGSWTLLGPTKPCGTNRYHLCQCKCGIKRWITRSSLDGGKSKSCGCSRSLTGKRFGRLTVLNRNKQTGKYICQCDCGKKTSVFTGGLTSGATKSCGCLLREMLDKRKANAIFRLPEYGVLRSMISRCENPNMHAYRFYGGRGITICRRWRYSFANFLSDMGSRPSPKHVIDRIDNNGNYTPSNCRWTTYYQNTRNRNCTNLIEYQGKKLTIAEWARALSVNQHTLYGRFTRGWSIERALSTPIQVHHRIQIVLPERQAPMRGAELVPPVPGPECSRATTVF